MNEIDRAPISRHNVFSSKLRSLVSLGNFAHILSQMHDLSTSVLTKQ